ncbi:hypothetical protein NVP1238A_56 [Vibrio phage 1.238.A._10N.261.52.F10]|uniref:Uncharacterized protein n=2 Tax=Pariacacavirus TaxID=2948856 RepID=A0A2I7RUH6_9CAUD|nr:hypothetical protein KNT79_gp56 [Vibrio phage 1.238.A._10N.261.52.F10]YP_010093502.1 hypothetical protein KNT80_gp59 [Vibrio phage 1.245.O._10N.261.54.C7]AUR97305.1 hypothetical protein NVP1238A_56 [Vibrio phage 1.238.A._10N.261.52.F10]AUR97399.1 hypothetical protein NVP1238B_57 [Vibrio phage 1.238.B._10N.261.52.F10]AUR97972.1 hypothetical protein NVP1245O_59 [Vibrio phage 1.245.O._10N.261.54.C7]
MSNFKATMLTIIEHSAISKAAQAKTDLIWESGTIYTGFVYKGYTFENALCSGVAPPATEEFIKENKTKLDFTLESLTAWQSIRTKVIYWLNLCESTEEALAWLPDEPKQLYLDKGYSESTEVNPEFIESITCTPEFTLLESLISFNLITE